MTLLEELDFRFPEANFVLAFLYMRGLGVERNPNLAKNYCRIAAEANLPSAQYMLATLLEADDSDQARKSLIHWYKKAAHNGHSLAAFRLADLYEQGLVVEKDSAESAHWYVVSAELGCSAAAAHLGWLYEEGVFLERNESLARTMYMRSVELNSIAGCMSLARAYRSGSLGLPVDPERARKLEEQASTLRELRDKQDAQVLMDILGQTQR